MTTNEELNKVLQDAANEGADEERAFLAVKRKGWNCVRPLVFWYYRHLCRIRVRGIEQRVDKELSTVSTPEDRVRAREILANETFAVGGIRVEWGAATAEQHLERAAEQRRLSGNCIKDAERHEQAAQEIRAAGVSCLNDLKKKQRRAA